MHPAKPRYTGAMDAGEARSRLSDARSAVLATADEMGAPHLVPITFVLEGEIVYTAVDGKPKRPGKLRRHENIRAEPRVCLIAEHWDEDWSLLWWVRVDGLAQVIASNSAVQHVVELMRHKYDQYNTVPIGGPVIEIAVHTWRGWASGGGGD